MAGSSLRKASGQWRRRMIGLMSVIAISAVWLIGNSGSQGLVPADRPLDAGSLATDGTPLHMLFVGTSLTAGADWPIRLQEILARCLIPAPQIGRLARAGAGSAWALTQIDTIREAEADIIFIEFAINDADLRDGVSLAKAAQQHQALIAALRQDRPDLAIVLMTTSPAQGLRGWMRPRLGAHYMQYRSLAKDLNLGLVDLWPRWLALPAAERGLDADGLHPAADKVAAVLLPVLVPYVAQAAGAEDCVVHAGRWSLHKEFVRNTAYATDFMLKL